MYHAECTYTQQSLNLLTSFSSNSLRIINKTHFQKLVATRRPKLQQHVHSSSRACVCVCKDRKGGGGGEQRIGMLTLVVRRARHLTYPPFSLPTDGSNEKLFCSVSELIDILIILQLEVLITPENEGIIPSW